MLIKLTLKNCFVHNHRVIEFNTGLTGITGPNESGKSLIVEMIRYALFGTKALRGPAEEYRNVEVELEFMIRDRRFEVFRKGSRVSLVEQDEDQPQKVAGTTAVNAAIIDLLGYDLQVFDVANVCNQGDVEKLTDMRPSERKTMVDQTVGLSVLDGIIVHCGREGNALKREADGFAAALVAPVPPVKPEGYVPSDTIDLSSAEADAREFDQLSALINSAPPRPEAPAPCQISMDLPTLLTQQKTREDLQSSIQAHQRMRAEFSPEEYSKDQLDQMEALHDQADMWDEKQALLAKGENTCPSCAHTWPLAQEELTAYDGVTEVQRPELSRGQIRAHRSRLGNNKRLGEIDDQIANWTNELETLPDVAEDIRERRRYELEVQTFEDSMASYEKYQSDLPARQARHADLADAAEHLRECRELAELCRSYETLVSEYDRLVQRYQNQLAKHADLVKRSEAYLNSRSAVQQLKVEVKKQLLPPLNKVASHLINQMTGGERNQILVDPDFEITVDGQGVHTLSGSGKAVANLAVRLALGQILTKRTFSVFMADEIDASMDAERAAYTAEALNRLKQSVSQILQVTHKSPETDHSVELYK